MARGLTPMFTSKQVSSFLEKKVIEYDRKTGLALQYIGEQFVNAARLDGNYTDRTGNLRSSIGYIVLRDGEIFAKNFAGRGEGVARAREFAQELKDNYQKGWVLIGVAGMKYAAYVEAKNFDVISNSAPNLEYVKKMLYDLNV